MEPTLAMASVDNFRVYDLQAPMPPVWMPTDVWDYMQDLRRKLGRMQARTPNPQKLHDEDLEKLATSSIASLRHNIAELRRAIDALQKHLALLGTTLTTEMSRKEALEILIRNMLIHEDRLAGHVKFARELLDLTQRDASVCPERLVLLNERHRTDTIKSRKEYEAELARLRALVPQLQRDIREARRQLQSKEDQLRTLEAELDTCRSCQRVTRFYTSWE